MTSTLSDHKEDLSLYSNAFGFLRLPLCFNALNNEADVVISGIPYDMATTGRPGTRFGPNAIRTVSTHLAWEKKKYPHRFDLFEYLKVIDCGDLIFEPGDSSQLVTRLEKHTLTLLKAKKKCLSFGGDHFVTLPLLRAHAQVFGKLALVHFDAHTDTYNFGSQYDHGTMFFHAPKEGLIDPAHSIQIGIRTEYDYDDHCFQVLPAAEANEKSPQEIANMIRERVGDLPVYLTFDIDCLDPAFAPGTGTPVSGGMSPSKIFSIFHQLSDLNLVGADVVEVSPSYDKSEVTALAAATIAYELLYIWGYQKKRSLVQDPPNVEKTTAHNNNNNNNHPQSK